MVAPITGTADNDNLSGTADNDVFDLTQGGSDAVRGKAGDDTFDMGKTLDATDAIRAGDGYDTVNLDGNYHLVFGATTISRVESIHVGAGHDYSLRLDDANVASGHRIQINGSDLGSGDILRFDGRAESDGVLSIYGGAGDDSLTGGAQGDFINGGKGDNKLRGGAGDDHIDSSGGVDSIEGGNGEDHASIYRDNATANLKFIFAGPDAVTTMIGDGTTMTGVEAVEIRGGSGNDHFTGGSGQDNLGGGAGHNVLNGAGGDDFINSSATAGDVIDGGDGFDQVSLGRGNSVTGLTFHFAGASAVTTLVGDGTTVTGVETFSIEGGSGNDDFQTGAGQDRLEGDDGNDVLNGRGGADNISGGSGTNVLIGGAGDDHIDAGGVSETVNGGSGTDLLYLNRYDSVVDLTFVVADPATYTTLVGEGTKVKSIESFEINGGSGNDTFTMSGNGDDNISGGSGNNHLNGAGGDDFLTAGLGDDVFNGGGGSDTVSFATGSAVQVDLASGVATGQGNDTLIHVENIQGSSGDDRIVGDGADNYFRDGYAGADVLKGGGGNDTLESSSGGADRIDGGSGYDLAILNTSGSVGDVTFELKAPDQVSTLTGDGTTVIRVERVDITGGDGNDHFTGGNGADILTGGGGANVLNGGGGGDILTGNGGTNVLNGGAGDDSLYASASDAINGGAGNDTAYLNGPYDNDLTFHVDSATSVTTLFGGNTTVRNVENFVFSGGGGNDSVITIDGADDLSGYDGNDFLSSGGGHDVLSGNQGADILDGGSGSDAFWYHKAGDSTSVVYDTILGFNGAQDYFIFSGEDKSAMVRGVEDPITAGALNSASFDADLQKAVDADHLHAHFAALFTADSGSLAGETFVIVDANGRAGYQAGSDYVIHLDGATHLASLSLASFVFQQESD